MFDRSRLITAAARALALGGAFSLALASASSCEAAASTTLSDRDSSAVADTNASAPASPASAASTATPAVSAPTAAPSPAATPDGHPSAAEQPFVRGIMADIARRFPTEKAAIAAGFLRYTAEDSTGAISYANRRWTSADPKHPSQLWYDVHGRLLGADFSVLKSRSPKPPSLWGVGADRWSDFPAHVHLALKNGDGSLSYKGVGPKTMAKGGGTVGAPTKAELVKAGVAPDVAHVAFVFPFPSIWDLSVWVLPNPSGAFADANPNVHPVHPDTSGD